MSAFVYVYLHVALHAASLSGHVSTVKLLLEKGAMVDSLDMMKHTPLFRACEMGHRDVILTLIKGGYNQYISASVPIIILILIFNTTLF